MAWTDTIMEVNGGYHRVIKDIKTGEVIVIIDNLDRDYVKDIIEAHNVAISKAREEGSEIAKEVYKEMKIWETE